MMYLVLLAMLALNVSREVLDAFVEINDGLVSTASSVGNQNTTMYKIFEHSYSENPKKVGPWYDKSQKLKKSAQDMVKHIEELKKDLVIESDGPEGDVNNIQSKDNTSVPSRILIGNEMSGESEGKKLKKALEKYREFLINKIENKTKYAALIETINSALSTDPKAVSSSGETQPWVNAKFGHLPLAAVVTMLTDLQIKVRYTESLVLGNLFGMIDAKSYKVNKVSAVVQFNKNYLLRGEKYTANIFLAAEDSTQKPSIFVDGYGKLPPNGRYEVDTKNSKLGLTPFSGYIQYKGSDGKVMKKRFNAEYEVAETNVVVSPTKMNAFYLGVPNPITVSVPGVKEEDISIKVTNGTKRPIRGSNTEYNIFPTKEGKAKVDVYAVIEGQRKHMKSIPFRVFSVPDPVATVGGMNQGRMSRNEIMVQDGVSADLKDFVFDMKFTVKEFKMYTTMGDFEKVTKSKSNRFTPDQRKQMKSVRKGKSIYIADIIAVGSDKRERNLPPIKIIVR